MVIVLYTALRESCVFAGSSISFSISLMNAPSESVDENGPYHGKLVDVFSDRLDVFGVEDKSSQNVASPNTSYYSTTSNSSGGLFSWFFSSSATTSQESSEPMDTWKVDKLYGQVFGLCSGDAKCLKDINMSSPKASPNQTLFNDDENNPKNSDVEFPSLVPVKSNSKPIFASKPKSFLDEAISLSSLEKKTITVSVSIPNEIPPSFKGTVIRYNYYLALSIQTSDFNNKQHKKVITVPFKVYNPFSSICSINSSFLDTFDFKWDIHGLSKKHKNVQLEDISYKYMLTSNANISPFFYSFSQISNIVAQNSKTNHYDIADESSLVCRVSLSSNAFYIGDTILGIFDFTKSVKLCAKVKCKLMYQEQVASTIIVDYYKQTQSTTENSHNSEYTSFDPEYYQPLRNKATFNKVSRFDRYTLNTITSDFRMIIPPHSPSQFSSDLIKVDWFLQFKFYLIDGTLTDERVQVLSTKNLSEKKDKFKVKPMTWLLPIHVFVPSNFRPLHEQSQSKEQCIVVL